MSSSTKHSKKRFGWFSRRQRFSIRKYHFGAASVLLGVTLASLATGSLAKADEVQPQEGAVTVEVESAGTAEVIETAVPLEAEKVASALPTETVSPTPEAVESLAPIDITSEASTESTESEETLVLPSLDLSRAATETESPATSDGKIEETVALVPAEETEAKADESIEVAAEEVPEAEPEPEKRKAHLVYSIEYVNADTGKRVSRTPHALYVETTQERAEIDFSMTAQPPAGYRLVDGQANHQVQTLTEETTAVYRFLVVKEEEQTAPQEGTGFRATTNTTQGEDVTVYTGTEHYKNFLNRNKDKLLDQITWIDFSDPTTIFNTGRVRNQAVGGNVMAPSLQVGTVFRKELAPGYVVELEVIELKPFEATEIYHERVKGTDKEQYYNPDRKNHNIKDGTEAHIIAVKQDPTWSHVRQQGLNFGNKAVTLQSDKDGGNVGVKFRGRATYYGNEVPLNFVFMSGEEAKVNEIEIYTTNGEGFELLGELSNSTTTSSYKVNGDADVNWGLDYIKGTNNTMSTPDWRERWNRFLYLNKGTEDVVNSEGEVIQKGSISTAKQVFRDRVTGITYVDGIGTQVFGPVSNRMPSTTTNLSYSTPLIFTRNATEVGMYIASRGRQSAMIGVVVADFGDAPDSYGRPSHTIQITNATKHPYLGTTRGDIDFVPEAIPPGAASWVQDELISSWDEGPNQLMGKNVQKNNNYTLHHSNNGTYSLQFEADPNTNATAYVQGWIDFNNNGKFDKDENSGVLAITNKGTHTLTFSNIKQISDENLHKLGVRLRIAIDRQDILTPDLPAYSGEVEDFQIQLTHPPRSEKVETRNVQGQSQTGTLRFYAFGSETYSDIRATIDTTIAPVMVDADNREVGSDRLDNQGFFYVQGEGKYKVEAVGKDVRVTFVPDPGFITEYADGRKVNQAKGISVRRTATVLDSNGQPYTTGWTAATIDNGLENTSEQISTMDGRYIPHVVAIAPTGTPAISVKMQGEVQTGRPEFVSGSQAVPMGNTVDASGQTLAGDAQPKYPIKLIDKSNQEVESTNAYARVAGVETVVGTYSIDGKTGMVTYTPNDAGKRFVGELLSAEVIARDANGAEARTTYTPSIMPVLPIAEPATTVGLQGKTQSGRVHFAKSPTAPSGVADLIGSSLTLLNEQNAPVTELVLAGQGTYRLESDGSITFVPLATFIGPATAVKVQMTDSNGSLATTTYTAIVVETRPVGRPQATYGLKGDVQTSSPDFFTPGQVDLDGDRNYDPVKEVVDLNKASLTLVDAGGQDVRTVRVENQGEYRLMDDGTITFTPDQNFVGQASPVTVKISDVNGTSATTLYTPTVIEIPEDQLTETVTRTIRYVYANGSQAFEPSEKTLHFTRTATANPLTGDISYSEWTSTDADFPAVTSPSLTNYTASLQEVLQETGVAATADDRSITVIYRENEKQLATITFKTESGTELAKDSQTGHSGSPISYDPSARIADLEQRGYVLVRNDFAAESDKTFDNQLDRDQNWDIVFKEKVVESVPDKPQNPGDPVDPNNPAGPRWEAVVKTITRTVSYKYDSQDGREAAPTQETSVTFKRTGSYNFVSKQVTYTDWVADQADTVLEGRVLPVLAGYTATSAFENGQAVLVASTTQDRTVTSLSESITELVVYTADTQQASISYKLENGSVLAPTDTVTGPSASPISYDTSARIAELVQKGYVLVRDGFTDAPSPVFDLDSLQHQSFEVIFKEQIITIRPNEPKEPNTPVSTDPNGPQYPDGLKESDLKDTVVRVIRYLYEDGTEAGDPVREELVFTRTATLNVVTKAIQYGPWESVDNQFDLVPTPEKAGYTPDQAEVAAQENVQALSPDSEIRVVYRKNRQLGSIRFVDVTKPDAPVQLNQVPLVGKTAEPFAYDTSALEAAYSSMGYQVTNRDGYSKDDVFDTIADNSQDFVFELVQRTSSSTPDNPQTPGTPVDASNPNGPKWEAVTSEISRTVSYHLDAVDGQVAPGTTSATTSVRYERTGIYNHVTKQVIYTPWVAENADTTLEGRTLPVVTGYVATEAIRNDQAIAPKATEQAIDILPLATNIVERVVYKSLSEWRITPPPGKDPVPPIAYPNHPTDPTKPADPTPAPGIPVHEGFIPVGPDGQDLPKDPVTNLYLPPVPTDPTQPTDIRYRALEQTAIVRYVLDGTEQDLVPAVRLTGDSEARIEHSAQATIAQLENKGYTLVTDGYSLDTGRFYDTDSNQDQEFRVSFKETVVTIVPTDPKNPGDPVDPSKPNGPSYPDGLTASDLKESVTRTIHYVYADSSQAAPSHSETLYYTRKAQVNLVTKVVTYEAWTSLDDQFKAVDSPVIRNFTPDQVRVAEKTSVDALAPDEVLTVIYLENGKQLATITYRLEAGTTTVEVAKYSLEGHPEQDIAYTTTDRIRAFEQLGYELVSDEFTAASPQERLFDSVENNIQNFDVILRAKLTTIQPNDPHEPGKPVDPNDPTSPVLEDLTETVTRRVKFTDQQGTELVASPTPTTAQFTRTATYNHVSKVVTYSDWIAVDAVVEGSPIPVVKGYIATTATANGEEVHLGSIAKDKSVKYNSEDIDEVVIYSPLGSWTPRVPDGFDPIPPVVYPNHPTDPTVPGTDRPVIPFVPGLTPVVPNPDNPSQPVPLTPVDPADPSQGYYLPPVPSNPGQDSPIFYEKDKQAGRISFINVTNPDQAVVVDTVTLQGLTGDAFGYDPSDKVAGFEKAGYVVTNKDNYDKDGLFSPDSTDDQHFVYELVEVVKPIEDPENPPRPGQPVDPNHPDGPVWPDSVADLLMTESVTRTIRYVDTTGQEVFEMVTETKSFRRSAEVNLVTGAIHYGDWTANQTLPEVASPLKQGYLADKASVASVEVGPLSSDMTEVVTYSPLGSWTPRVPDGFDPIPPVVYPNHPTDPTVPGTDRPIIPFVPGLTPVVPNPDNPSQPVPLTPVDPADPSQGYYLPPVPSNPGQDSPIFYEKDKQAGRISFINVTNPDQAVVVDTVTLQGLTGDAFGYDPSDKVAGFEKAGYVVTNKDNYDKDGLFSPDSTDDQHFVYELVEVVKPIEDPENPPRPGQPVDPNHPDGPVWPDSVADLLMTESVTRTIRYVDTTGQEVFDTVTETKSFRRSAEVNLVTGAIHYGDWTANQTLPEVASPLKQGYLADKASVSAVEVGPLSSDMTEVVTYSPLGSWTPRVPDGFDPIPPVVYPNHPTDPTVPGTDRPIIPFVPGLTPVVPNPDNPSQPVPLTPVDPADPSQGYYLPPVLSNPGQDSPIFYEKDKQAGRISFINVTNPDQAVVVDTVTLQGLTGDAFGYDPSDKVAAFEKAGYVVTNKDNYDKDGLFSPDSTDDQHFVYELVEVVKPIEDPENPPRPGQPVDPNHPDGPVWPDSVADLLTTETVTRTIRYVDTTGQEVFDTVTETKSFRRSAEVNLVTGAIHYGDWTANQTLPEVASPLKQGYLADKASVSAVEVGPLSSDMTEVVTYSPLGSWTPRVPDGFDPIPPVVYPNHPTDPTVPGTDRPIIPFVPGLTPVVPNPDNPSQPVPLTPVDPADPSQGYYLPPVPSNPGQDSPIFYEKDKQAGRISFINVTNPDQPVVVDTVTLQGLTGDAFGYDPSDKVAAFEKAGYVVTNKDNYDKDGLFSPDSTDDQHFVYELVEVVKPIEDPENPPRPGQPVDPNHPDGPVWPDSVADLLMTESVTRTIRYVDTTGQEVFDTVTETKSFRRSAEVNLVTGAIHYGDWTANQTLPEVASPLKQGYLADKASVSAVEVGPLSSDMTEVVTYSPLGSWTPRVPDGFDPIPPVVYPNHPTDPTVPGTDRPIIPFVPGLTPVVPNPDTPSQPVPLTPVDPADPSQGYYLPPVPSNPGQDSPIFYEKDKQAGRISFINVTNPDQAVVVDTVTLQGLTGDAFGYDPSDKVAGFEKAGYVVTNKDNYDKDGLFSPDSTDDQHFVYELVEVVKPIEDPENPPRPGQPVDPNHPDGPVWPDSVADLLMTESVTRTIRYVDTTGQEVFEMVTETKSFRRSAEVNLVTGAIHYGDWTANQTLPEVASPLKQGYLADKASVASVEVGPLSSDMTEVVTYSPLGSWTPRVPDGFDPIPPVVYPNHPTDPTVPGTDRPIIPFVPGLTPVVPNPDNPSQPVPLTPVDPADPSQGYYLPPVPSNPGQDSPIFYEKDKQAGRISFINVTNPDQPVVVDTVTLQGLTGDAFGYDPSDKVAAFEKAGYVVTNKDNYDKDGLFSPDSTDDQHFVYELVEVVKPIEDPENPPRPGQPVDPNHPDGPVWPDSVADLLMTESVTRTIRYVDTTGQEVFEMVTETKSFRRSAEVNLVTGAIHYGDWTANQTLPEVASPLKQGYLADKASVASVEVGPLSSDMTEVVTYSPLGSWTPRVPDGFDPIPPVVYPNHPTDPTAPGTDRPVIPFVPGLTPVVPNPDNPSQPVPLTPVDPADPSRGYYLPPVPSNPGQDSPIFYEKDKQAGRISFINVTTPDQPVVVDTVTLQGLTGDAFGYDPSDKVAGFEKAGYVVTNKDNYDKDGLFSPDSTDDQHFVYELVEVVKPIEDPENPPRPGQPVDPNHPDGPVWPDSVADLLMTETVTRTIRYVDTTGQEVFEMVTETKSFRRSAEVNLVTGAIHYGDWTANQTLPEVASPLKQGYLADKASVSAVEVGPLSSDMTEVVTYSPLGSWTPRVPDGFDPIPPVVYPNHPTDPTAPGTDRPVIPFVPGLIPFGPDGQPLEFIDPKDPTKGYRLPPMPENPSVDTVIEYIIVPEPKKPATETPVRQLPKTGESQTSLVSAVGVGILLAGLGMSRKGRKDQE